MNLKPSLSQRVRRSLTCHALCLSALAPLLPAHEPAGLLVDEEGVIFCVDFTRHQIWRIENNGEARVLARGNYQEARLSVPHHLFFGPDRSLYTASDHGGSIWRIDPEDGATQLHYPPDPDLALPSLGVGGEPFLIDESGTIYCVRTWQGRLSQILRLSPGGSVERLAGEQLGHADGSAESARFGNLHSASLLVDGAGRLLLSDSGTMIRAIELASGKVQTLAGSTEAGYRDGPASEARFSSATALAMSLDGTLYICDADNRAIRGLKDGVVTAIYQVPDERGKRPSSAVGDAQADPPLTHPDGIAVHPDGRLIVLDHQRDRPRVHALRIGQAPELIWKAVDQ